VKIGFQTIVWGPRVRNLEYMLDVILAAGYQGVELFQRPEVLGSIDRILKLLEKRQLQLIGLSGGSLQERMDFCGNDFRPEYLYLDAWDEEKATKAMEGGFTLGLHPHAYMPVGDLADAMAILENHPESQFPRLKFIADSAHLTVTHDDPIEAIQRTKARLVAVHLKDWSPEFGRSPFRYARGFAELGAGSVDLHTIIALLKETSYDGWLVAEQDYTLTDPDSNTLASARWLAKTGILPDPRPKEKVRVGLRGSKGRQTCRKSKEVLFSRQIARARLQEIGSWYDNIALAFRKLVPSKLVEVWSSAPKQDIMSLVAIRPNNLGGLKTFIPNRHDFLGGTTMERKAISHFDLRQGLTARRFEHPELIDKLGLHKMVSLPIFNPWNFNHVRLIVNLFPSNEEAIPNDDELFRFSANVAFALDEALEDLSSASATKVSFEAGRCASLEGFLESLARLIKRTIGCEGVAIFLVNDSGDKLELRAGTGTTWKVGQDEQFYVKGEGLTGGVWESRETFLTLAAYLERKSARKSVEGQDLDSDTDKRDDCLFVPLMRPTGEVLGVVRCRRKAARHVLGEMEQALLFSDDDTSVLEATIQTAGPHIETLKARQQREKTLRDMKTSLRVLGHETKQLNWGLERTRRNYLSDVDRLRRLSRQSLDNICRNIDGYFKQLAFLFTQTRMLVTDLPRPKKEHFWAYADLLFKWGDIYRLEAQHRSLEFDIHHPYQRDPERPKVYGDKLLLEQLLYNLVSNAVKYCYQGTKIKIECKKPSRARTGPHILSVINYGREFRCQKPFRMGDRGDNVVGIEGIGIGLYNAKRVADAHKALFEKECDQVSEFNVPIIEPYLVMKRERRDMTLCDVLEQELARLRQSDMYDDIVARSRLGLRLYQPEIDEVIDLIRKPTWRVAFRVTLPAKGS